MSERPKKTRAARGAIPYALVAAVFLPVGLVYLWWFRSLELLRFAHPAALALIPLAVALVVWAGIRRAPARCPVRQGGCASTASNGCTAWQASRGGCGSAISSRTPRS